MSTNPLLVLTPKRKDPFFTSKTVTPDPDPRRCRAIKRNGKGRCRNDIKDRRWATFCHSKQYTGPGFLAYEWWNTNSCHDRVMYYCQHHTAESEFGEYERYMTNQEVREMYNEANVVYELADTSFDAGSVESDVSDLAELADTSFELSSSESESDEPLTPGTEVEADTRNPLYIYGQATPDEDEFCKALRLLDLTEEDGGVKLPGSAQEADPTTDDICDALRSLAVAEENFASTVTSEAHTPDASTIAQSSGTRRLTPERGNSPSGRTPASEPPAEATESEVRQLTDELMETARDTTQSTAAVTRNPAANANFVSVIEARWALLRV